MFSDYEQSTPSVLQYSSPAISSSVYSNQGSPSFSNSVNEGPFVLEVFYTYCLTTNSICIYEEDL